MSTVHFLNVGKGDCTLIQHNSGRNSLIDISKGNYVPPQKSQNELLAEMLDEMAIRGVNGNFGMSKKPTNPLRYLEAIGVTALHRFILTHPDMDHLDGLDALMVTCRPCNFWHSGVQKAKPDFDDCRQFREEDWDRYEAIVGSEDPGLTVLKINAGDRFKYANMNSDGEGGGDGLSILSPDKSLVNAANESGDTNDASFVLLYRVAGEKILIPGDAHDDTWRYVVKNHAKDIADCSVLFAPHHGRRSGADFSFLDIARPKVTFFGCANSGELAYDEWSRRKLQVITNNQAGNIVLECNDNGVQVFVENAKYAKAYGSDCAVKSAQGYVLLGHVPKSIQVAA